MPEVNRVLFPKPIGQETNVEPDLLNLAGIPGLEVISIYMESRGEIHEKKHGKLQSFTDGLCLGGREPPVYVEILEPHVGKPLLPTGALGPPGGSPTSFFRSELVVNTSPSIG